MCISYQNNYKMKHYIGKESRHKPNLPNLPNFLTCLTCLIYTRNPSWLRVNVLQPSWFRVNVLQPSWLRKRSTEHPSSTQLHNVLQPSWLRVN
ncbi:hypothetical protein DVH24_003468 [Malus domestica]|uniref:Uncharacterized protein n=1 Tax=Malus domestica TaxID=3750 RepID=A0A498IIE7_MALDO|nr:hypothetical protein DVH24_003468 [Malus domestica]